MTSLAGRVAVITGGSRGIGLGIAQRFAQRGAHVVITSRKADAVQTAARSIGPDVLGIAAHVADDGAAQRCFAAVVERWGGVDILVNNAGTNPHFGLTATVDKGRWDKIMDVNVWAPLRWTQLALEAGLGRDEHGSVINIASNIAASAGGPSGVYAMSKTALIYLTQQLAVELGPRVRVNALAPGVINTDMAQMLVAAGPKLSGQWPLPRFGQPSDVADAAEFLAGSQSSWITGQVLTVDGGATLTGAGIPDLD